MPSDAGMPPPVAHRRLAANGSGAFVYEPEFASVESVKIVASLASLLGCFFVITTYWLFPPLRRYHSNFVLWIAVTGMLFHGNVVAQTQAYGECCVSAPITHVSLLAQEMYFFMLAFNFYYTTKYPFISTKLLGPLYHAFVWVVASVSAYASSLFASGRMNAFGFCWLSSFVDGPESVQVLSFMVPVGIGYVVSIAWYLVATKRVRLRAGGVYIQDAQTNLDTMRNFLLSGFSFWVCVLVLYLVRQEGLVRYNSPLEKAVRFSGRMLMALRGLLGAVLWAKVTGMRYAYDLWKQGDWDDYMKENEATWILRRQILYFATKGIQYSISQSLSTDSTEDMDMDDDPRASAASRWSGLYPWGLGARDPHDGPSVVSYELQGATRDNMAIFRDFQPSAFEEIRRLSGISNETYMQSFAGRTKERFSEGKSGSFLYYTGDQLFILKTCTKRELRYLLEILPPYMDHLRSNPNSYLCRYVGCHELVMDHLSVSFIVLTNILHNTAINVDEYYDLKGSWVGRFRMLSSNGTQRVCKFCGRDFIVGMSKEPCDLNPYPAGGHAELVVGKDLNWGGRRLRLPRDLADQLGSQLYADSEFLRRMNSMDYSLIIGMSRRSTTRSSFFAASEDDGAVRAQRLKAARREPLTDEEDAEHAFDTTYAQAASPVARPVARRQPLVPSDACVVSLGIIDILTPWSFRKSVEHWVRVYIHCRDRSGISCVNPQVYAERFRRNVIDIVVFGRGKRRSRRRRQRREQRLADSSDVSQARTESEDKDAVMVDFTNTPIMA
ncbi:hypothetical protein ATCC90586_002096 [Pythium insidiosum]|nr:hypothetical protein ATCC90586_002096 [Pythium insidiosum]